MAESLDELKELAKNISNAKALVKDMGCAGAAGSMEKKPEYIGPIEQAFRNGHDFSPLPPGLLERMEETSKMIEDYPAMKERKGLSIPEMDPEEACSPLEVLRAFYQKRKEIQAIECYARSMDEDDLETLIRRLTDIQKIIARPKGL